MSTNAASKAVKEIRLYNNLANPLLPPSLVSKGIAYKKWADLVNEGQSWDHKSHIRKNWTSHQTIDFRAIDKAVKIEFFYDIWSNIHYGYVGLAAGFSRIELLEASSLQSQLRNGFPDPPSDVASIKIGFRLYNGTLTISALMKELYTHSHELTSEQGRQVRSRGDPCFAC